MLGRFLVTASLTILSNIASVHATNIGTTVDTPCPFGDCAGGISLSYLGEFTIPAEQLDGDVPVGGLSGLTFDAATGQYIAISDDRSEKAPARFLHLDIDVSAAGITDVTVRKRVVLEDKNGQPFAPRHVDPESIRIGKDAIYWSSEGDAKALVPPFVRVTSAEGVFLRELKLPDGFAPMADKSTGIRDNLAFEALAVTPSGHVFAGLEAALHQDGPNPSLTTGSLSRIIRWDAATEEPNAQFVYPVSPIPQVATKANGGNDNGLSEMVALDDHRLIVVERSFAQGFGNTIRLFMVDIRDATDVSPIASLAKSDELIVPVRKTQILDLRAIGLVPDNIECMAIGKAKDGTDVLILAADNNFSDKQKNQFFAFQIKQ
ncbi:esterase-like activity of phytase family protein [Rhizobium sp. ZK1]|uniref:esterase-like activity of phytase family protein n=1 Tax=Rhizobium sp. ZK1 TaxID=3389872 RepID=UPI0039F6DAFD